jgi:hypothetical protein
MTIPSLTSVLGTIYTPPKHDSGLLSTKNLALGGIAATSRVAGGIIGKLRGNPLAGLGIGAAIASVAIGAALLGNASNSYYDDGYGGYGGSGGGRRTSPGDDGGYRPGNGGGHTSPGDSGGSGGSHSSGNSTDNGNPSDSDF